MSASLQGKLRGDAEWIDMPGVRLADQIRRMKEAYFKVEETDTVTRVINPITKQIEVEYRIV